MEPKVFSVGSEQRFIGRYELPMLEGYLNRNEQE